MATPTGIVRVRFRLPTPKDATDHSRLAITRAALQAISGITRDTRSGVDMHGRAFVPYSPEYAAARLESGRKADPPDLTLTGTMLRALRVLRVDGPRRAVIGWEGQHTTRDVLAAPRRGGRPTRTVPYLTLVSALQRRRPFFGIVRPERVKQVREVYTRTLRDGLANDLNGRGRR